MQRTEVNLGTGEVLIIDMDPDDAAQFVESAASGEDLWRQYQSLAVAELEFSDRVAVRCLKAGVAYPNEWLSRDNTLRDIVRSASGDHLQPLPTRPAYPAGT